MTSPVPAGGASRDDETRLDELEALREAATPGPWHWDPNFAEVYDTGTGLALTNDAGAEIVGAYNYHCCDFRDDPRVGDADAALIVAAVNALPDLIAAARAHRGLADAVRALADELAVAASYAPYGEFDKGMAAAFDTAVARLRGLLDGDDR